MNNRLLPMIDKIMLRSVVNFMVNIIAGLIAYTHQEKKRFSALGGFPDLKRLNQEAIS